MVLMYMIHIVPVSFMNKKNGKLFTSAFDKHFNWRVAANEKS